MPRPGSTQEVSSGKPVPCPSCGAPASGRFCTECGAVVRDVQCGNCGVSLTPGAKFCHDCGAPVGAQAAPVAVQAAPRARASRAPGPEAAPRGTLPWILAGLAFVTLVVIFAAQRVGQTAPPPMAGAAPSPGGGSAAIDISSMSPQERASRLFDRIMRLSEDGKQDSVALFSSMAIPVYESLGPLDLDSRYDLGRIAQVSGQLDLAQAQSDTILRQSPNHLLGLILALAVADARGNSSERSALQRRLLDAETSQLARGLEEYVRHKADIDAALAAARSRR
ncbi:MAG TPA: zinc-ribbon domain-containing protein [Gemmatimonadaceae bacterium]